MFSTKFSVSEIALPDGGSCDVRVKLLAGDMVDFLSHEFGKTELRDADLENVEIEIIESSIFRADGAEDKLRDFTNEELSIINDAVLAEAKSADWEFEEDEPMEIDYND